MLWRRLRQAPVVITPMNVAPMNLTPFKIKRTGVPPMKSQSTWICLLAALAVAWAPSMTLRATQQPPQVPAAEGDADPLPPQETPQPPALTGEELFEQGRKAMFQGDSALAVKLLRQAVAADPNGAKTIYRLHLARALRYAKQPQEAEKLLKQIIQQSPEHVEAGQLLAEIHYADKRWREIIQVLEPLLEYRHDYPTYHLLAEAAYYSDDYDDARKYYLEAIRLNPESAVDRYQLGNIYLGDNRFALAAMAYERAIKLGLESNVLHYKLASAYFNLRNYFGKVATISIPAGKTGEINGDWYLIEPVSGQPDVFRAAPRKSAIYQIALSIKQGLPQRTDIRMLLANIHLNARRYASAYALYQQLDDKVTEEDRALYLYYFAQSALGVDKYEEYLKLLKQASELAPDAYGSALVDAYLTVADKNNQAGRLDEYVKHLELAVRQSPQDAALHLRLGDAYEELRRTEDAVQQWRMVLDLQPDHPRRTQLMNKLQRNG